MLDLGFVSAILDEKNLEQVIQFADKHNFRCVEVMCWPKGKAERRYAGVTHIDVDRLDDRAVAEVNTLLNEHKIYISGLGYYPNPLDPDQVKSDFYFAHIKKVIDAANRLIGLKYI